MKKLLLFIVAGMVSATVASAADPPAGAATFEMTYRGLTAPDDPLSYRSYWGFGQSQNEDTPFIAAVKAHVDKYDLVFNAFLPQAFQWSLVELKDGKPVAFYLDANGDGAYTANEKFGLAPRAENSGYEYTFITSDFNVPTQDGDKAPFRVMLVASGSPGSFNYMWSPFAILEGQATLNGQPTKLVLYADSFTGSFSTFRNCSIALMPANEPIENSPSRQRLSRLLYYQNTFYRLTLSGAHAQDRTLQVVMTKDTTPTGRVELDMAGSQPLKASLTSKTIEGTSDNTVYFNVAGNRNTFPAGDYRLLSGTIGYQSDNSRQWQVTFSDGPEFKIAADATSTIALGKPTLAVNAVREDQRYNSDVQPTTTFDTGTAVYIEPQLTGKAGETYQRFASRARSTDSFTDACPHLTITGPSGNEIVSTDLEYG